MFFSSKIILERLMANSNYHLYLQSLPITNTKIMIQFYLIFLFLPISEFFFLVISKLLAMIHYLPLKLLAYLSEI